MARYIGGRARGPVCNEGGRQGCNCRHPVSGTPPDYHWIENASTHIPRWRNPLKWAPDPLDWWYSVKEISQQTGRKPTTITGWLKSGKLQGCKPGGRYYFVRGRDLEDFMRRGVM